MHAPKLRRFYTEIRWLMVHPFFWNLARSDIWWVHCAVWLINHFMLFSLSILTHLIKFKSSMRFLFHIVLLLQTEVNQGDSVLHFFSETCSRYQSSVSWIYTRYFAGVLWLWNHIGLVLIRKYGFLHLFFCHFHLFSPGIRFRWHDWIELVYILL